MQAGVAEWVAPKVRRVLAPNPTAMTGPGTNSYLLGQGGALTLVDPGPLIEPHITALLAALGPAEHIARIIVTHAHLDHSAAAPRLSALTGAPVLAFGGPTSGRSAMMQRLSDAGMQGGGEGVDTQFRPDATVIDGQMIPVGSQAAQIIHTPGHMGGHICLAFGPVLLSGDHVLGWSSSLISPPDGDMGAYMASLSRLMAQNWSLMLPGHGAAVKDVTGRLHALQAHRMTREASIRTALSKSPATPRELAAQIYCDVPATLMPAALRNILAHLIDLIERNLALTADLPTTDAIFASRRRPP
jgi:glyoxylase-like metal-dependent hydrolase (beta-lactamase superfamily II)